MTAMAVDPYNAIAIGVGVLQYGGFAICSLAEATMEELR